MRKLRHLFIMCSFPFMIASVFTGCTDENVIEKIPDDEEENTVDSPDNDDETDDIDQELLDLCHTVMDRIKEENMLSKPMDPQVEEYLNSIQTDGSFPDVDYTDKSFDWTPMTHLNRVKQMAQTYIHPESRFYESEKLYIAIVNALDYWNEVHPVCDNWYENQIRVPKCMGEILILLRYGKSMFPSSLEDEICKYWEETGGHPSDQPLGSNKSDIALHWLYRGVLQEDENVIETAAYHSFVSLEYVTPYEEGIQYDLSFFQHGPQLYIGGYGDELLKGVTKIAVFLEGTKYSLNSNQRDLLYRFVNETYMGSIRAQYQFYNVVGRSVARSGSLNRAGLGTYVLEKMKQIDPVHVQEYERNIGILNGNVGYENVSRRLNHYYIADYMSICAPSYSVNVRLSSVRTSKIENGNGENLKSFFMSDGSMDIAVAGDEYADIFPVWDWCRVPGVTNPYMSTIPLAGGWGKPGESDFCGGVGDGIDGLSAFHMVYNSYNVDMSAKKAYFFLGDEIVCLGSGITSKMTENINTTVDQCLKKTGIWYSASGQETQLAGTVVNVDADWVWHRNVGYFFPGNEPVSIKEEERSGKWSDINSGASTSMVKQEVFTVWFDHGTTPESPNDRYCYIIVPGMKKSDMGNYKNQVEVVSNTTDVMAICNSDKSVFQAVFYKGGEVDIQDFKVKVDNPCVFMIKKNKKDFKLYFSDPSHKLKSLSISLEYGGRIQIYSFSDFDADNIYKGITHQAQLSFYD